MEKPSAINETNSQRIKASPLARKLAEKLSLGLDFIKGSGPNGRIIAKDVEDAANTAIKPNTAACAQNKDNEKTEAFAPPLHQPNTISSTASHPGQLSLSISVDMEQASKLFSTLKDKPEYNGLNMSHFIIKATAYALKQQPSLNCFEQNSSLLRSDEINIELKLATHNGCIRQLHRKVEQSSLRELVAQSKDKEIADLRDSEVKAFSLIDFSLYGLVGVSPALSPGQCAALGVGALREEPVVKHGSVVPGICLTLSLSLDSSLANSTTAAEFLKQMKQALEVPALLM